MKLKERRSPINDVNGYPDYFDDRLNRKILMLARINQGIFSMTICSIFVCMSGNAVKNALKNCLNPSHPFPARGLVLYRILAEIFFNGWKVVLIENIFYKWFNKSLICWWRHMVFYWSTDNYLFDRFPWGSARVESILIIFWQPLEISKWGERFHHLG